MTATRAVKMVATTVATDCSANDSDNNDSSESTFEGFINEDFQSNLSTNGLMTIQLINLSKITVNMVKRIY